MVASQALGEKLSSALDENVDGCADSCLTQCGDGTCGKKYGENCSNCPTDCGACAGNCCETHLNVGCEEPAINACVCATAPACCALTWYDECSVLAEACGATCEPPKPSPCCDHQSVQPGCDLDPICETCVCDALPYCCIVAWDEACTQCGAGNGCGQSGLSCESTCGCTQGPLEPLDCCTDKSTAGCSDAECEDCVCALEPACCEVAWDGPCDLAAAGLCNDTCGCFPSDGSCCKDNGSAGCSELGCQGCVCGLDPYCCDTTWDFVCSEIAQGLPVCSVSCS